MPEIVLKYLERHGMVAIDKAELEELRNPSHDRECPYPLFTGLYGIGTHAEYLGSICENEGETLSGLVVVRCTACGHVSFETPVAIS